MNHILSLLYIPNVDMYNYYVYMCVYIYKYCDDVLKQLLL